MNTHSIAKLVALNVAAYLIASWLMSKSPALRAIVGDANV